MLIELLPTVDALVDSSMLGSPLVTVTFTPPWLDAPKFPPPPTCNPLPTVTAYTVMQRTRELGIRLALGAQPGDVLRIVLGHGARLVLAGLAIGTLASLALTRLMTTLLFGIGTRDPMTFAGVGVLLAAVSLLACYIPARRAMRVDPVVALRN